ncbi:hypothetical protein DACRYDRAFT_110317 [Dacryopinax primogenitus]|uniref:BAH-domain-containing protein n=1 Tax=Dacryopinax primogenitus (strain DJM 731) TaxID=1858805 RepID=M5G5F6_DACPD|nr:uncharacterized protein DACRYDRAFT_110317 [Dacryopinax primogenitus]EJT98987.1 hypothetical protein DACRYDRAFT_110317 [Dacryopinax primogenitus]
MPLLPTQSVACYSVISTLTSHRENRRNLSAQFTELPDKNEYPEYYRVIPEPRSLSGIKASDSLDKGRYNSTDEVWSDLKLVFLNAMHYNEEGSSIWRNAKTLETLLTKAWVNTSGLPDPPPSPPPGVSYPMQPVRTPMTAAKSRKRRTPPPDDEALAASEEKQAEKQVVLAQSDEMVRRVEESMEKWPGYGDVGWMGQPLGDPFVMYRDILQQIRDHQDEKRERISKVLDMLPDDSDIPYLSYNPTFMQGLLSLKTIEAQVERHQYNSSAEFDQDLTRLFEKGRRFYEPGSEDYGKVILLQRMYHQLTAPDASSSTGNNFASVAAGPGNAKPLRSAESTNEDGVTSFRISSKERQFTDSASFKGQIYRVGDYVHLMNPDDPAKPIIAQVFKTFLPDGASLEQNQPSLTVCWYYRPEQTIHPAHRQFYMNEVFKTSHFADHAIGDVIEKIGCQFTTKYTRGRPKAPYWYPGWPLYICDSRYNDKEKAFVKIKNWNSCIPDELRKMDFMPVQPFERTIVLRRVPSPFLIGGKGPGKIGEPEAAQLREDDSEKERDRDTKRKRLDTQPYDTQSRAAAATANIFQWGPTAAERKSAEDRTVITAAGGAGQLQASGVVIETLPPETVMHFARDLETGSMLWFAGPPMLMARARPLRHSLAYLAYKATGVKPRRDDGQDRAAAMEMEEAEGGERSMVTV